jgi:hypothetical protein
MRRPISSKSDTCTESLCVYAAGISVKVAAIATANRSAESRCDTQLMAEAYATAMKDVARPEKVRVILSLASQFSKCGIERGFELLSAAIKVANQLPSSDLESSVLVDRRARVVTYTVAGDGS